MSLSKEQRDILVFFNLENDDVEDVSFSNVDGVAQVDILLRPDYPECPACGYKEVQIKGYQVKEINHSVLSDRPCRLYYHARRYRCPLCHRTYYEHNPFVFNSMKISTLTVHNVLADLKCQTETFTSVARRYHISQTTAASIFDHHVMMPRLPLPQIMCWDEAYAFHHRGENSKYVFTILDFKTLDPVDILPSRKKQYLISYFMSIPIEERRNVKMISTDMYGEFRSVIHTIFPNALHSCDHYHVSQDLSRRVDRVRIRVMNSVTKYEKGTRSATPEYYLLKKFNWLIFKRKDTLDRDKKPLFDPNRERKMNIKLNRMLNYYEIRESIEAIHPDLKAAWRLKDDLVDFYDENTYETAPESLNQLIQKFQKSPVPEMKEFAQTLSNWKEEIVNSFIIVNTKYKVDKETGLVAVSARRVSNGVMENRNAILKLIKKSSNSYSNWNRFRNRCLYVLRKDAVPLLNPVIPKKVKVVNHDRH